MLSNILYYSLPVHLGIAAFNPMRGKSTCMSIKFHAILPPLALLSDDDLGKSLSQFECWQLGTSQEEAIHFNESLNIEENLKRYILAISNLRPFPIPTRKRLRNLAKFFQRFFIKRIVQSVIIHNIIFPLLCDWEQKPVERKNEKLFLMWNELDSGTSLTPSMHVHWLYQPRSRKGGWFVPKGTTIHRTPATEYSKRQKKKGLHHLRLSGSFS